MLLEFKMTAALSAIVALGYVCVSPTFADNKPDGSSRLIDGGAPDGDAFFNQETVGARECSGNTSAPADSRRRPRIGLALGGGGVRGAAHLGVMRVLEKEGIPIDCISGTSIGSVIGGMYAAGVPLSRLETEARSMAIMKAFKPIPIPVRLALMPITTLPRLFGSHGYIGLFGGKRFSRYLDRLLPEGRKCFEDTYVPFQAVATDLLDGQPFVFKEGSLNTAIRASCAIPWIRKPVKYQGRDLCDGFLSGDNLPVRQARSMGADLVICSDIDGPLREAPERFLHYFKTYRNRTVTMLLTKLDEPMARQADVLICPAVSQVGLLSGKRGEIDRAIASGEEAARAALPKIRKALNLPAGTRFAESGPSM